MPDFTLKLKDVIELRGGTRTIVNGISYVTGVDLGLSTYAIFDNAHRDILNGKIVDHYLNREIGAETIEMWQLFMRRRMNEIMPYFNQLYNSELIDYQALSTIDLHTVGVTDETSTNEGSGSSTADATGNALSRGITSETPQTLLSGDGDYATSGVDSTSSTTNNQTGSNTSSQNGTDNTNQDTTITGYQGVAADLVMRFRDSLLNIDMMVIQQLEDCFMLVWDNGNSYTQGELF